MTQKLSCPVPKDQRPINEYMKLVQSNFFNWPILSESLLKKNYLKYFFPVLVFLCLFLIYFLILINHSLNF